ncbi:MAG: hypothetical protein Q4G54_00370 [Pelistega sp.]|nr:hypothetical protein [Pelistega sp.]
MMAANKINTKKAKKRAVPANNESANTFLEPFGAGGEIFSFWTEVSSVTGVVVVATLIFFLLLKLQKHGG